MRELVCTSLPGLCASLTLVWVVSPSSSSSILLPYSVPVRMAECLSLATCTLRGHAIDRWWMHEVVGVLWVRDVTNVLSLVIQPKLS